MMRGTPVPAELGRTVEPRTILTDAYDRALSLARRWHAHDVRRGTDVLYLAHLLAVSSIVLEAGGDEVQAIAALLHDSLEDAADMEDYRARRDRIAALARGSPDRGAPRLGAEVLEIVETCTDGTPAEKRAMAWRDRKERYVRRLREAPERTLLVAAADKLHNARAILYGVRRQGPAVLDRFHAPPDDTLWYYRALADIFSARFDPATPSGRLASEIARIVAAIEEAV